MQELQDQIKDTWLRNNFGKIGRLFSGWIPNTLQTAIVTVFCILVVRTAASCVKRIFAKSVSQVRFHLETGNYLAQHTDEAYTNTLDNNDVEVTSLHLGDNAYPLGSIFQQLLLVIK